MDIINLLNDPKRAYAEDLLKAHRRIVELEEALEILASEEPGSVSSKMSTVTDRSQALPNLLHRPIRYVTLYQKSPESIGYKNAKMRLNAIIG